MTKKRKAITVDDRCGADLHHGNAPANSSFPASKAAHEAAGPASSVAARCAVDTTTSSTPRLAGGSRTEALTALASNLQTTGARLAAGNMS